ncbi:MAG: hypothetical protein AW07_04222 [Candidatus Accumulibacter sp. SK-11]|nr:MAG: hypothetical protein AW07_04222 [Candidatus Accumulibacter sp. SK-11]
MCWLSSSISICCSGVSAGSAFRKARAVFAFSATKRVSRRARSTTAAGSTVPWAVGPSGTGIR